MTSDDKDAGSPGDRSRYRPTVVAPEGGSPAKPARPRQAPAIPTGPTVMSLPARAKLGGAAATGRRRAQESLPAVVAPTAVPGVERKRIVIEVADLAKLSPGASPAVLADAIQQAQALAIAGVRERDVILCGHRLQKDYSELVSRTLELGQADVLVRTTGYLRRMTNILQAINLEVIGGTTPAPGLFDRVFGSTAHRVDTGEELLSARREIDQLIALMESALEQLLSLKEAFEHHSRRVDEVGASIEAAALAMTFLSHNARDRAPGLAQRFTERSMSLTQTLAQIRESKSLREVHIDQPLLLISAIQNVALVTVPALLGDMVALAERRKGKPTPTEIGELKYQLRATLQQLDL